MSSRESTFIILMVLYVTLTNHKFIDIWLNADGDATGLCVVFGMIDGGDIGRPDRCSSSWEGKKKICRRAREKRDGRKENVLID